jgi:hypothetical protein
LNGSSIQIDRGYRSDMDQRAARARQIQQAIGRILLKDWNPIRVPGGVPPDEYDAYIGGVYRLLSAGAGAEEVAAHLGAIERDAMGLAQTTASVKRQLAGRQETLCIERASRTN